MKKDVTIYDIAKALGISTSTVSRALSNSYNISNKTKTRVFACANRLGYRHNPFASNLRKGSTNTIGVIVHRLDSMFVSSLLSGTESTAASRGYNLLIVQSFEDVDREIANAKMMLEKRVDGLMVAVARNSESIEHFKPFFNFNIPVAFLDRIAPEPNLPTYTIDNYAAARKMAEHLAQQGCKNIIHATIDSCNLVYKDRIRGFDDALNSLGIEHQTIYIDNIDFESGKNLAIEMYHNKTLPDGIFFSNDMSATGFIIGLQEMGVNVPNDIAVAGFNNDISSRIVNPSLTTINYPASDLGSIAVNHIIDHIRGINDLNVTEQVVLKSDLIIRDSTIRKTI